MEDLNIANLVAVRGGWEWLNDLNGDTHGRSYEIAYPTLIVKVGRQENQIKNNSKKNIYLIENNISKHKKLSCK